MFAVFAMSAAMILQGRDEMDGMQRRRIFEAANAAKDWARWQANQLISDTQITQTGGHRHVVLQNEQDQCRYYLTIAALDQVCKDYRISSKTLQQVMADQYLARQYPHIPEHKTLSPFFIDIPRWKRLGTAFRPEQVRLRPSLAKRFGYRNEVPRPIATRRLTDELIGPANKGDEPIRSEPSFEDLLTPKRADKDEHPKGSRPGLGLDRRGSPKDLPRPRAAVR